MTRYCYSLVTNCNNEISVELTNRQTDVEEFNDLQGFDFLGKKTNVKDIHDNYYNLFYLHNIQFNYFIK